MYHTMASALMCPLAPSAQLVSTPLPRTPQEMVPEALKRMRVWVLAREAGSVCHTMASVLMSIQQNRCSPSP